MSEVKTEDISLLESGGSQANLIPVQGGGGSSNADSLLDDGNRQENLIPVQGGGENELAVAQATSEAYALDSVEAQADPLGTMFSTMSPVDQIDSIRSAVAIQMLGNNLGLNDDQVAEIIVNSTLARSKKAIRQKYGIREYDVDSATQSAIDNGTPGERQAARDAISKYTNAYRKKNEGVIRSKYHSPLKGTVLEFKTPLKKKIDNLKDVDVSRDEFSITQDDDLNNKLNMNITSWMNSLDIQIKKKFPTIVRNFIQKYESLWTTAIYKTKSRLPLPILRRDLVTVAQQINDNKFEEANEYGRYVAVIPYTVQQFVVVPPIAGSIQKFKNALFTLQKLNIIKYKNKSDTRSWQVANKTVVIFSHPFYDYDMGDKRKDINRQLFAYMNELDIHNKEMIYCLSDGGSSKLSSVSFFDICNFDNENPAKHIKPIRRPHYILPTLLSPTYVLFPYQLNTLNGILISGEGESNLKPTDTNFFNTIYKGASYGKYEGHLLREKYPLSKVNQNICSIRMDSSLYKFIEDTNTDGIDISTIINTAIEPIVKQITDLGMTGVSENLFGVANTDIKTGRGKFIIETEAIIKIQRQSKEISEAITTDSEKQQRIRDIINSYDIPNYEKYLRFPFTNEVNYIKNKMQSIGKNQNGGGNEECDTFRVIDENYETVRTKVLSLFDKELYITNDILLLHVKPGFKPKSCPAPMNLELFGSKHAYFEEHKVEHEIANIHFTQLISLGGKTFEIREIDDNGNVIRNWQGRHGEHVKLPLPILTRGEADLLNSLKITPQNMDYIFYDGNPYGLDNWRTAFSDFFVNIVLTKCYKDTLLLTNSECQQSRNFLYSIRQYIDRNLIKNHSDYDSDSSNDLIKDDSSSESDEEDRELDRGDIAREGSIQQIDQTVEQKPTFAMHQKDGIWRPSVKVFSVNRKTGEKKTMILHRMDRNVNDGDEILTEEDKRELQRQINELQTKYPNLVIHTY